MKLWSLETDLADGFLDDLQWWKEYIAQSIYENIALYAEK